MMATTVTIVLDRFIVLARFFRFHAIPRIHTNAVLLYTCYNDILLQLINIHHRVCLLCVALRQPRIDLGL